MEPLIPLGTTPNLLKRIYHSTAPQLARAGGACKPGDILESTDILLNSDLDLAGHSWVPIGNQLESNPDKPIVFSGSFDGNGHVISNLTIGSQSSPYEGTCTGLFGAVSGHISNLSLENAPSFSRLKSKGSKPMEPALFYAPI